VRDPCTFASIIGPRTGAKLADLWPPTINNHQPVQLKLLAGLLTLFTRFVFDAPEVLFKVL
jgi:hypothetical protein